MAKYRVNITDNQITDCYKVYKSQNWRDYAYLNMYKSFAHIDPVTYEIRAYLVMAKNEVEAKEKVAQKLTPVPTGI